VQNGLNFIEVVSNEGDQKIAENGALEDEIKKLEVKANQTESYESKAAINATI
jgi:cell division septum initiation protein DivIVA